MDNINLDDIRTHYDSITDEEIDEAKPFSDHQAKFVDWAKWYWETEEGKKAKMPVAENAWHIKYLAGIMISNNGWVGDDVPKLSITDDGFVTPHGNHRIRALQWLRRKKIRLDIEEVIC